MKQQSKSHTACRAYLRAAPHLLELPADDPARREWLRHAVTCPDCAGLLKAESEVIARFAHLPVPEPAYVRARVMAKIRASRRPVQFWRRDFAWGAASALVGVVIGLGIAASNASTYAQVSDAAQQEAYAGIVSDSFDDLATEITAGSEESR